MPAPTTPFEDRGHAAPWTSLAEGEAFLDALEAYSPRITTAVLGQAEGGANMRLVKLQHPTTPASRTILYVANQHGGELAGRDAMYSRLRDWAVSNDPAVLEYLAQVTILCIPTAHPDNLTERNNVNNVNVNRDHVNLTQSETQIIHEAIRDRKPAVIVDLHEARNITEQFSTDFARNPATDPALIDMSTELSDAVRDAVTDNGYTWELYQGGNIYGPEYLHTFGALNHSVTILLESRRETGVETDAGDRYQMQLISVDRIMDWHHQNLARVDSANRSSVWRATQLPAQGERLSLVTGVWASGPSRNPHPGGYRITDAQHEQIGTHRNLHSIAATSHGDGWDVSLSQKSGVMAAYLLDELSEIVETAGEMYEYAAPQPPAPSVPYVDLTGETTLLYRSGGVTRKAQLRLRRP